MAYSTNPTELADQLIKEHEGGAFKATAAHAATASWLVELLTKLIGKFDFTAIVALAKQLIPLVMAGDWKGVSMALLMFFLAQPSPTPNPTPIVSG